MIISQLFYHFEGPTNEAKNPNDAFYSFTETHFCVVKLSPWLLESIEQYKKSLPEPPAPESRFDRIFDATHALLDEREDLKLKV